MSYAYYFVAPLLPRSVTALAIAPRALRSAQQASRLRSSVPRAQHHAQVTTRQALRDFASCLGVVLLFALRPCYPAPDVIALRGEHSDKLRAAPLSPCRQALRRVMLILFCRTAWVV